MVRRLADCLLIVILPALWANMKDPYFPGLFGAFLVFAAMIFFISLCFGGLASIMALMFNFVLCAMGVISQTGRFLQDQTDPRALPAGFVACLALVALIAIPFLWEARRIMQWWQAYMLRHPEDEGELGLGPHAYPYAD